MEFKDKLKEAGLSIKAFADLINLTRGTVYAALSQGAKNGLPTWAKSFVIGLELGKELGKEAAKKNSTPDGVKQGREQIGAGGPPFDSAEKTTPSGY